MRIPRFFSGRRKWGVAVVALVSASTLGPAALYGLSDRADAAVGAGIGATAGQAGQDVLADLEERSPGARLVGIATKAIKATKRAAARQPGEAPEQQALGKTFDPPVEDPLGLPWTDAPPLADNAAMPETPAPGGGFGFIPGGSGGAPGGFFVPGGGSSSSSGGGSSGGGTSGGGSSGGSSGGGSSGGTPPPVAAVPEPATWAMMILGFGAIGGAMRRRSRESRLPEKG